MNVDRTAPPGRPEIAAVVVLYNPDSAVPANLDSYRAQVDRLILVDNTETPDPELLATLSADDSEYLRMPGNCGIAAALNAGCRRALKLGYSWVLTMDQDSTATPHLVSRLAACLGLPQASRLAVVAPIWRPAGLPPVQGSAHCVPLPSAMTTGNLLRLAAFVDVGGFREDLFIDRVDTHFCLLLRHQGWLIAQRRDAVVLVVQGQPRRAGGIWPFQVTNYSPLRRYYMIRNVCEVHRLFGAEFPEWFAIERRHWRLELLHIAVGERQRAAKARMMLCGWLDYRRGHFGRYEDLHPAAGEIRHAVWRTRLWRLRRVVRPERRQAPGQPLVSIIVLTYNRLRMLRPCLTSLIETAQGVDYELIVWDNASTDGTREYLDEEIATQPRAQVIHHPENVGENGYAASMRRARGLYLMEIDDDVLSFPPGWLAGMIRAFRTVPRAGFLAANVVQDETTNGAKPPADTYRAVDYDGVVIEHGATGGWCSITSREVLQRVGEFLELPGRTFYGEDGDYARRCVEHGYRVGIIRDITVYHASGWAKNVEYGCADVCRQKYEERLEHTGDPVWKAMLREEPPAPGSGQERRLSGPMP